MALSGVLISLGTVTAIYALLALGLNVKYGYSGLLDIGHAAFFLVGAYTTTLLVLPPASEKQFGTYILGLEWGWVPALVVGTIAAGIAGMLVALPAIRLREDYLAIAVLGVSVIARRIVQSEGWLANGPDTLRGWSAPLVGDFPLPGPAMDSASTADAVFAAFLLGAVVAVFWAVATWAIARLNRARGDRNGILAGIFALLTLGVAYAAAGRTYRNDRLDIRVPVAAGLVAGAAAAALSLVGLGEVAILLFAGLFSVFTWIAAAAAVAQHYARTSRYDVLLALGIAVAVVVAFAPLVFLGGRGGDFASAVGMVLTGLSLVGIVWGSFRLAGNRRQSEAALPFISVVGIATLWLFLIRYFLVSTGRELGRYGPSQAAASVIENFLWLVSFGPIGVEFDYARFLFVVTVGVLGLAFYATEATSKSPFGRVLRAIREDEDVARALGKDTFSFKVQSMIIGSAMAGLAGGLFAIHIGALNHLMFHPRVTFTVLLMVIIGGTANNHGAVLGAAIFWGFQEATVQISDYFPTAARARVQALRLAFLGALLIIILYYRPEGIWSEERSLRGGKE